MLSEVGEKIQQKRVKNPKPDRSTNFKLMVSLCLGFIIPVLIFFKHEIFSEHLSACASGCNLPFKIPEHAVFLWEVIL